MSIEFAEIKKCYDTWRKEHASKEKITSIGGGYKSAYPALSAAVIDKIVKGAIHATMLCFNPEIYFDVEKQQKQLGHMRRFIVGYEGIETPWDELSSVGCDNLYSAYYISVGNENRIKYLGGNDEGMESCKKICHDLRTKYLIPMIESIGESINELGVRFSESGPHVDAAGAGMGAGMGAGAAASSPSGEVSHPGSAKFFLFNTNGLS